MIRALINLIFGTQAKPSRDEEGRFVSRHHAEVITVAKQLRASMPDRQWKHSLDNDPLVREMRRG